MAWEPYKPENRVRTKKPRAQIQIVGKTNTLLINSLLGRELGFNSLIKCAVLRYDKERNVMGLSFHQAASNRTTRLGKRTALDGTTIRTLNVAKFLYDVLPARLPNGTYNLNYHRENDILVLSLDNLVKNEIEED